MANQDIMNLLDLPIQKMESALKENSYNPNDLLGFADFLIAGYINEVPRPGSLLELNSIVKNRDRFYKAEILSRFGIEAIEKDPSLLDYNVELGPAYFKWAALLIGFNRIGQARMILERAVASGHETQSMQRLLKSLPPE